MHLIIKSKEILPYYLRLVLNSIIVQLQAERDLGGSIIKYWRIEEIKNVIIPILEMEAQIEISKEIQESFRLWKQSKKLLKMAIKSVEITIDNGEVKALEFISNISKNEIKSYSTEYTQ